MLSINSFVKYGAHQHMYTCDVAIVTSQVCIYCSYVTHYYYMILSSRVGVICVVNFVIQHY